MSTFSSLKKQDFRVDAVSHGREFLLSMLLCRKVQIMCSSGQESPDQSSSTGTREQENKASVPKPGSRAARHQGCRAAGLPCIHETGSPTAKQPRNQAPELRFTHNSLLRNRKLFLSVITGLILPRLTRSCIFCLVQPISSAAPAVSISSCCRYALKSSAATA